MKIRNRTPHMKLNFRKFILAAGSKNGLGQGNPGEEPIIILVKVIRDEDLSELELCQGDGCGRG